MKSISSGNVTWIDIKNPSAQDITSIREEFQIHPLAVDEFATPTYRARATKYPNCLFLSVHIPLFDTQEKTTYSGEIDIILTPTHLITGHRKTVYQLEELFKKVADSASLQANHMSTSPAHLLYEVLRVLFESCFPRLEHISKNIDRIEKGVFRGQEREMVREISITKRDILNFRRIMMPGRTILESLITQTEDIVPIDAKAYFRDLVGTNIRLWNMLESAHETIRSLEETNDSLLSQKINSKMRILTVFSVIVIPMTLYANVLGINVTTPLADHPHGFGIHLMIMFGISLGTIIVFRLAKWF